MGGDGPAAAAARATVRALLRELGEDVGREGLLDTPERVAKAWVEMTSECGADPSKAFGSALFHEPTVRAAPSGGGIVCVRDIAFASLSSADLLPFHGRCHIMYAPANGAIVGLSKLARLVRLLSRRIQSQEELTYGLAEAMRRHVAPEGVAVVVEARHVASGPEGAGRATWASLGDFADNSEANMELQLVMSLNGITAPQNHLAAVNGDFLSQGCGEAPLFLGSQEVEHHQANEARLSALAAPITRMLVDLCRIPPSKELTIAAKNYARHMLSATSGYSQLLPVPHHDPSSTDERKAPSCQGTPTTGIDTSSESTTTQDFPEMQRLSALCSCQVQLPDGPAWSGVAAHNCPTSSEGPPSVDNGYAMDVDPIPTEDGSGRWPLGQGHWLLNLPGRLCEGGCFPFRSTCEHHLLPFYGDIFVAYTAGESGLNLTREQVEEVVNAFTHRLQVQERISHQVADALEALLVPSGVLVVCQAAHTCMLARGVECHSGATVTTAVRGRVGRVMVEAAQRALREGTMSRGSAASFSRPLGLDA